MKSILSILFIASALLVMAQTSGEIIYEETVDIHRRLTGERAQFKEFVPQFRKSKTILLFTEQQALYKRAEVEEDAEVDHQRGGRRMRMRMMSPDDVVWLDHQEGKRVEQRNFMDKKFLIKGEPETFAWKLTGESKQVGKYLCQQATYADSTNHVVAWFTPMVPVPLGPSRYGQLPGLILHVDINEGERTLTAQEINLGEIDATLISEPTKGKEVTQAEFREIMHEKMKEMREHGGGRGLRIRH